METINICENAIRKNYDLEIIVGNSSLNYITMSPHELKRSKLKKYKHVMLLNINGLGTGQVHFMTDDGHYLLIPWCYIISMIPSKNEKEN